MKKIQGKNKSLQEQIKVLKTILQKNNTLWKLLTLLEEYQKENKSFHNYYVAAGCVNQTIFNYYHDFPIDYGIKDYDIVYYDEDISYEAEDKIIHEIEKKVAPLNIKCDIKNEKRVALWYKEKFHKDGGNYESVEDAIRKWTTTITCLGVRLEKKQLIVCAPYGLDDLFSLIIRPVQLDVSKEIYEEKCKKWLEKWPKLEKIEWK